MPTSDAALYKAFAAKDPRFDGVFYVGVRSTGIYCRPICPARTPKQKNCRFFTSAAAAEKDAYRPCLRCRPGLAPGSAPVDDAQRIAELIVQRMNENTGDDSADLETIAAQFELSSRQIRRIVQKEMGVTPMDLILTRRLLLAKQLLTETQLPVTEVAFASGFASVRRFNDAFLSRYHMAPRALRKTAAAAPHGQDIALQLAYRPPLDWDGVLAFLKARALRGVEDITPDSYARTVSLGGHRGWLVARRTPHKHALTVTLAPSLTPVLPAVLDRLRSLFDLTARPDMIDKHLRRDAMLAPLVKDTPGLRVPGTFDGFELAVRAVLGQQVSVKAATTLAGRFVDAFGDALTTPYAALTRLSPTAEHVAEAHVKDLTALGLTIARAATILRVAEKMADGSLVLAPGGQPEAMTAALEALPGIGPWTAHYIAMRALRWPDAFPKEDMVLRKAMGGMTATQAETRSQSWRPWRSYAVLHLWRRIADIPKMSRSPRKRRAAA